MKVTENYRFTLNKKKAKAVELLINGEKKVKEIADEIGISDKTLWNWRHNDEEFRRAMEWYRREIYKEHAPEAVRKIIALMRGADSEETQRKAAEKILALVGDDVSRIELDAAKDFSVEIRVVDE